jgi:hypothetical protein
VIALHVAAALVTSSAKNRCIFAEQNGLGGAVEGYEASLLAVILPRDTGTGQLRAAFFFFFAAASADLCCFFAGAGQVAGAEIAKHALQLRANTNRVGASPKDWLLDVDEDYFFPDYSPAVVLDRLVRVSSTVFVVFCSILRFTVIFPWWLN